MTDDGASSAPLFYFVAHWVRLVAVVIDQTELHHITRLEDGGAQYDEDNIQALCKPHHVRLGGMGGRV